MSSEAKRELKKVLQSLSKSFGTVTDVKSSASQSNSFWEHFWHHLMTKCVEREPTKSAKSGEQWLRSTNRFAVISDSVIDSTGHWTRTSNTLQGRNTRHAARMDCSHASIRPKTETPPKRSVGFVADKKELSAEKKKYLTAKYGQHQMQLIKKRLTVEMWLTEQLQELFEDGAGDDVDIDLDELLDVEDCERRKQWLRSKLRHAKRSPESVETFIGELMARAATL